MPAGSPVAVNVSPVPSEKLTGRPSGLLIPCGLGSVTSPPASCAGTDRLPVSGRFRDELPIMIGYVPAGVVHADVVVFQYARSRAVTVKLTVWAWPAFSVTRWKCLSWRGGSPLPAGAPAYNCTTSLPARLPVLVTVAVTVALPPLIAPICRLLKPNVV